MQVPPVIEQDRAAELLSRIGKATAQEMLERMWQTRAFEEKAEELYGLGKLHGTMHLSIGQEATAAGASFAIRPAHDFLLNHHRGHGHCIAWGSDPSLMMAEFMGKESGYCRGRGGSMHIADVERNNLGANGIVAGGVPIAVGVGLSIKMRKTDQLCLVIYGDGASNEGAVHESMNMASIWNLPVIYVCENNHYAMSMDISKAIKVPRISDRAAAYGIPGVTVDGNDVLSVYEAISQAAERARRSEGPSLVETITYRWKGHSKSDRQAYRTRDEVKEWQQKDPIPRFTKRLMDHGYLTEAESEEIKQRGYARIQQAFEFADASAEPDVASILEGIYA